MDYYNETEDSTNQESNPTSRYTYYASDTVGQYIVDAITGAKYPWRVGSLDEKRFFKVRDVSNQVNFMSKEYGYRVSHTLYYESPYKYMKHRNVDLDNNFIKEWCDNHKHLYQTK